jgi:hypothetical protein
VPASRKKIAKTGEFVISQHGGIVGVVLEVVKDRKNTRYKIGSYRTPFWVFHDELSSPRPGNFDDLVRLYDSLARLYDRFVGLVGDVGAKVRDNIFDFIKAVALDISSHKKPNLIFSRRVLLDFGKRAGFDETHMAEGRALFERAA